MTESGPRIFVAGHRGMVGSAIVRALRARGDARIITRTHAELDLCDQRKVEAFFATEHIDQVYLAAARVGGIHANSTYPAEFIYQNLAIATNVIHATWRHSVSQLLFLGSSCIYPKHAAQPMREDSLLTGPLEPTNAPYALAKIAGIQLCMAYQQQYGADFRCVMPTNLYGPGDNYHPENSHVIPGLLRRFHDARLSGASVVTVWGSGRPLREFLHVDDLAAACLHVMSLPRDTYDTAAPHGLLNIGSDDELSISRLARLVAHATGFEGDIAFDSSKPDGTPRKRLDCRAIASTGWRPAISITTGLHDVYASAVRTGLLPAPVHLEIPGQ